MKPHGRKHSPLRTVLISNLAIWPTKPTQAESQALNLTPATASPRQPMQRIPYDHEGRRRAGHALLVSEHISLVVSHVFLISRLEGFCPVRFLDD